MEASLAFPAILLLSMGRDILHFRSLLSVSAFVVFAATFTAVVSLQISGVLVSPTGFRWTGISSVGGDYPSCSGTSIRCVVKQYSTEIIVRTLSDPVC